MLIYLFFYKWRPIDQAIILPNSTIHSRSTNNWTFNMKSQLWVWQCIAISEDPVIHTRRQTIALTFLYFRRHRIFRVRNLTLTLTYHICCIACYTCIYIFIYVYMRWDNRHMYCKLKIRHLVCPTLCKLLIPL